MKNVIGEVKHSSHRAVVMRLRRRSSLEYLGRRDVFLAYSTSSCLPRLPILSLVGEPGLT